MRRSFWWGLIFILIVIALIGYSAGRPGKYNSFAQCLTDEGVKMYGAYWCPHCAEQKGFFGKSWKYVNYVECATPGTDTPKSECTSVGIGSYPTWIFADGSEIGGVLSMEQLATFSGCELAED